MREQLHAWLEHTLGVNVAPWLVPDQTMMVGLGFLAAAIASVTLARRAGLPQRNVALGLAACFVGALVGSRLLGAALRVDVWLQNPWALIDPRRAGSMSFGALLGGAGAFWLYTRRAGLDPWRFADVLAPGAGLGLFFARLGCFLHGCDFGRMTSSALGVRYAPGTPPYEAQVAAGFIGRYQLESLPVVPFQLALAVFDLAIFVLFVARPALGGTRPGSRALLAGAIYFAGRFVLEFARSPLSAPMVGFLNLGQWLAVASLVVLYGLRRWRDRHAHTPAAGQ